MSLPGLLIEYLVSGALALLWLHQFVPLEGCELQAWHAPLVGALLYVVGMAVDLVALAVLRVRKSKIRAYVARRFGLGASSTKTSGTARLVFIQKTSPTIAAEVAARSSRDRIARGTFVNAVIATALGVPQVPRTVLLGIAVVALILWLFSEATSFLYELRAAQVLGYDSR